MNLRANTAVRLRATSELLIIDSIDEDTATALCRRFGSGGPEGVAESFPLDGLRENVIRSPGPAAARPKMSPIGSALCRTGVHGWEQKTFRDRPLLGDVGATVCKRCGEIRLDGR